MTPLSEVYNSFLFQIEDSRWENMSRWEMEMDLKQLFLYAISWFKFPRVSLDTITIKNEDDEDIEVFENELVSNSEIQVIVAYMKYIWIERLVNTGENLRPMYSERDFSPAKMLNELRGKAEDQLNIAKKLEARYYRSINNKSFPYRDLMGRN